MAKTSAKPSGLKVTRNGNKFVCSWKRGESYASQSFQYKINDNKWISASVSGNTTSKTISATTSKYYPTTETKLEKFSFRVKGKKSGKKYCNYVPLTYKLGVPNIPTITATLDSTITSKTKFEWTTDTSDSDEKWFRNNAFQTVLVEHCNTEDGNEVDWSNAEIVTKTASGEIEIAEDTSLFDTEGYSYTRWVRMWSRGVKGDSGYRYASHVYSMSNQTANVKASASLNEQGGYTCIVSWDTTFNVANPADETIVQYTITTPATGMTCPSGASWTDANVSQDIGVSGSAVFSIDNTLGDDECLFVRVNTKHDSNVTNGSAVLADVGTLEAPTGLSVTANSSTHQISVTCTNNSTVPDSYIAIRYVPSKDTESAFVVGVIPHGSTTVSSIQCPNWGTDTYNIEAYAVVGSYDTDTRSDNVIVYEIDEKMRSVGYLKYGGTIPSRPANVNVSATDIKGTVRVTWDWTWADAEGAELSWADHADAWESTEAPETFEISRIHTSAWNISNLETGIKWYVRVRLFSGTDTKTYGLYSDTVTIDLSSAPSIPTLVLSDSVITEDGEVTASWAYSTTDGTGQAYAEICEATLTSNGIVYGDIIAHTQTAQHITINAKNAGWETGETYLLCVRVVSASGKVSDEWSDPVAVTIAEPLECDITDTSLVVENIETNPRSFTGNPVSFTTEIEESFAKLALDITPVQDLSHGDPSPTNICPITGWGSVNVDKVGKNLMPLGLTPTATGGASCTQLSNGYKIINTSANSWHWVRLVLTNDVSKYQGKQLTIQYDVNKSANAQNQVTLIINDGNTNTFSKSVANGETITIPSNSVGELRVVLYVALANNVPANEYVEYTNIQIELGSTATSYEKYNSDSTTYTTDIEATYTPTVENNTPYLFKQTGDVKGDRLSETLVGGTVVFNQLADNNSAPTNRNNLTITSSNDGFTVNGTANASTSAAGWFKLTGTNADYLNCSGHRVLVSFMLLSGSVGSNTGVGFNLGGSTADVRVNTAKIVTPTLTSASKSSWFCDNGFAFTNAKFGLVVIDLTQMFGSTIADYVYTLESGTAGAGVAWLKSHGFFTKPYYAYNTGELVSVNTSAHVTAGFNQWDEEVESGAINTSTGANATSSNQLRSKNYIPCLPNTEYYVKASAGLNLFYYDVDKNYIGWAGASKQNTTITTPSNCWFMRFSGTSNYGTTYKNDICINLSCSRNGEYEPYTKHTYALGNVTLRGLFQLDANNNLYCDGDLYPYDGNGTCKYEEVDLGDFTWQKYSNTSNVFVSNSYSSGKKVGNFNIICSGYAVSNDASVSTMPDKCIKGHATTGNIYIKDSSFATAWTNDDMASFKTAMSGIKLVLEKATPSSFTADPFTQYQVCSPYGTEEYTDTRNAPVPVGHNTQYYTRDIYGGTLDLISGVLTVSHKLVDLGDLSWSFYGSCMFASVTDKLSPTENVIRLLCESYTPYYPQASMSPSIPNCSIFEYSSNATRVCVYDINYNNSAKVSDFITAVTGQKLIYELATPLTYHLTPQQINTLVGQNNVFSDLNMNIRIAESIMQGNVLTELPLTVTATGAGDGGTTIIAVERAGDYHVDRPDETEYDGYDGETIVIKNQIGENEMTFEEEDLIGSLDDGASYRITATAKDSFGQSATKSIEFVVHWTHQAIVPSATVVAENGIVKITPTATGALSTDTADIYRLSADKPQLIYKGASFGTTYVDPYPTIGEYGGHRIVFKTANGDYITEDGQLAVTDFGYEQEDYIESEYGIIIDFPYGTLNLLYNIDVSNTWEKDFQETKYLGGAVQGDWNPSVSRTATVGGALITLLNQEEIALMRRLATYSGMCHVRTHDGSNYSANVQVSEQYNHEKYRKVATFSLNITKVDNEELDGMTLAEWQAEV